MNTHNDPIIAAFAMAVRILEWEWELALMGLERKDYPDFNYVEYVRV